MTDETIRVHVIDYGRKSLYMRYRDPLTGKHVARSTGTTSKKEANRIAAKWEGELQAGRYKAPSKITWAEFREVYVMQAVPAMADKSFGKINAVFNSVERIIGPRRLRDLDAAKVMLWQSKLRSVGRAESTIGSFIQARCGPCSAGPILKGCCLKFRRSECRSAPANQTAALR